MARGGQTTTRKYVRNQESKYGQGQLEHVHAYMDNYKYESVDVMATMYIHKDKDRDAIVAIIDRLPLFNYNAYMPMYR